MGPLGPSTDGGRLSRRKAFKKEDIGPPFVSSCDQNFNVTWPFFFVWLVVFVCVCVVMTNELVNPMDVDNDITKSE